MPGIRPSAVAHRDGFAELGLVQRAGLRDPRIAANAARKFGQLRVELVDVAFAPARNLPIRRDAKPMQQAFQHGPEPTISFRSSGRRGRRAAAAAHRPEVHHDSGNARSRARAAALDQQLPPLLRMRDLEGFAVAATAAARRSLAFSPSRLRINRARSAATASPVRGRDAGCCGQRFRSRRRRRENGGGQQRPSRPAASASRLPRTMPARHATTMPIASASITSRARPFTSKVERQMRRSVANRAILAGCPPRDTHAVPPASLARKPDC